MKNWVENASISHQVGWLDWLVFIAALLAVAALTWMAPADYWQRLVG
jgi:hypothetical protein